MKALRAEAEAGAIAESIARRGFAVARSVVGPKLIARLVERCPSSQAGVRDLLGVAPVFGELAGHPAVGELVAAVVGRPGFVTRAILFDKSPDANWALGFHQDVAVAVAERIETPGFGPWSVKAGIPHVRPPAAVLEQMITVRVHLDDCAEDNGPLTVIPGSHAYGFLSDDASLRLIAAGPEVTCAARAGDAVLMRPLLLHGSPKAERPVHRRVAHFEFAADPLPPPLRWRPQ
ncbi:MAG: phytanoyl-CoA dioxygenase family protein [Phycisphaerales bacterium]